MLGILLLVSPSLQAQVAKPKPVTQDRPVRQAAKKSVVTIQWQGSSAFLFTFEVDGKEVKTETLDPGEQTILTTSPGHISVRGKYKGKNYFSELKQLDVGKGVLTMTFNGSEIILKYVSEEEIERREREERRKAEEAAEKVRQANATKAQGYIDKAFDYIGVGKCDDAMTYYRYAQGIMSSSDPDLQNLYRQVEACKTKNAFENMVTEADNYKRRGYLETALGKYKESLKLNPRNYQVSQKVRDVERAMSQARRYESDGDRYMRQKKYDDALSSYEKAKNLWSQKSGIQESYEEAAYMSKKARGIAALQSGDYDDAVDLLKSARSTSRGLKDSDLKSNLLEAQYQQAKARGDKYYSRGDYADAYEEYTRAKSAKETDEISELAQKALVKMFDIEYDEVLRKDNINSYENFLQRWNSIPRAKELRIQNRLVELEMKEGRRRFFNKGYYSGHFRNAKSWLDKADPQKERMRERRIIDTYLDYTQAPRGFQLNYSLPVNLGFSSTSTYENLNDVTAPTPLTKPGFSTISREKWFWFNRLNGGAKYQDELIIPFGERYLAFPVGVGFEYYNNLVTDAEMTSLQDMQSDGYTSDPNYSAYTDTIAAYKGDNTWADRSLNLDFNAGFNLSLLDLVGRIHILYNFQKLTFNPYQSCAECGGDMIFDRNFLSAGISVNWRNRIQLSYFGKGGLFRGDLGNPENSAFLLRAELFFGDMDAMTRFSLRGEYFKASLYNTTPPAAEPNSTLKQFRLFPTLNFQF